MNILTNMQNQNSSGSGTLPSNTVANPRDDVKAITTRSGVAYNGPTILPTPSPLLKEVECETEATKDKLKDEEKAALFKVLKSHKWSITWKISDIKGIDPSFCTHKILMEDDFKPAVQHQRRVNPKIHEVIKKEVIKLPRMPIDYPILIVLRLVTGWRVCIDYRKLNDATRKDHFPLPFMDQMLERLAGNEYYCFLDGFSGYFQIPIDPQDQEKTTALALMERLPTDVCLSTYVMLRARSKGA
ncbi:hypothetical protein Tco_1019405 [Tanacetum coccineum]|uniref:Reverse transcriptase domain-containing protein n=1 Tax=Tanacetum coccineum TaxID=301880 RepID=A0ABQ5FX50_9ASTR